MGGPMTKGTRTTMDRFEGFADREGRFFRALARNQRREWFVAAGQYMMQPDQLARFREAVLDERRGGELTALLRKLERAGFTVGSHEVLQRVPRSLDPAHPRAELLKRKGLIVTFPEPPRNLLVSRAFVDWLVKGARRAVPLVE